MLPTFSDLAGNKRVLENLDRGSFASILNKKGIGEVKRPNRAFYFHRFAKAYPHSAILLGKYKLLKFWKTYKVDLYNLPNDLREINDNSNNEKTKTKKLEGILMAYITKNNSELLNQSI